jgi:homocysteine S-methyltransferase
VAKRSFTDLVEGGANVLGDGACGTRLKFETPFELDPILHTAGSLRDRGFRGAWTAINLGYLSVAAALGLPFLMMTPTFRTNHQRMREAGIDPETENLNRRGVDIARTVAARFPDVETYLEGAIGPSGDNQDPNQTLDAEAAERHHVTQARELADAGVDVLLGATIPAVDEATGMARALGSTGTPYTISLMIGADGQVLDGSTLADAIDRIDRAASPPPLYYSLVCVHPALARLALASGSSTERVLELRGNGAPRAAGELEASRYIVADHPEEWAEATISVALEHGLNVLGGCCGTDDRHILSLGVRMTR